MPSLPGPRFYVGSGFDSEDDGGLADAYENTAGLIAYLDETYRAPAQTTTESKFYFLTAVLVEREKMAAIRSKLVDIAGSLAWHTSEQARTDEGKAKLLQMTHYLARSSASVLALKSPIALSDGNAEGARAACFEGLLGTLCSDGLLENRGLAVYDRRRDPVQRQADRTTITGLRKAATIHRNLQVHEGRPAREALLWAPDAVSWASRQALIEKRPAFLKPLLDAEKMRIVRVP